MLRFLGRALRSGLDPTLRKVPNLRRWLVAQKHRAGAVHQAAAQRIPALIPTRPDNLTIAITARCNLRCLGCRYERDFMLGEQLPLETVRTLLDDAAEIGFSSVRFYGGEPLLHPDLEEMVRHACSVGVNPFITTNGIALEAQIDKLVAAGCRYYTLGFYGTGADHAAYTQREGGWERYERSIATVRERYGDSVTLRINWLLRRQTCDPKCLEEVWEFAQRYNTPIQVDLVHYSLPYFTEGPEGELQFRPEDRPAIDAIVQQLLALKHDRPDLIEASLLGIRSIPDWLLEGAQMRVPCDRYKMIWVGADGSVQLCYVTFKLGNLHETRLMDMVGGREHRNAARAALRVDCPNCHCGYDTRIQRHAQSRRRYRQ